MAVGRDEQPGDWTWQQHAACRGEQAVAFFPPLTGESKTARLARERVAKQICGGCPVAGPCLDYAVRTREPHGVWGGLNELERRQIHEGGGGR